MYNVGMQIKITVLAILLLILASAPSVQAVNETVGNWTFDEGSGDWANDTSGYNNNGTINNITVGNVSWTTNLVNGSVNDTALQFDGNDGIVNISTSASLNVTNTTMSVWIKPATTLTGVIGGFIVSKYSSVSGFGYYFQVNNNTLLFSPNGPNTTSTTAEANRWDHYVGTYDGLAMKMYKNGALIESSYLTGLMPLTGELFQIGCYRQNGNELCYNGTIDEVRLYNYSLNQSQITTLYQQFHPVPAYPVGGITIAGTYPPITSNVNFTWHDTVYPADELIIAEDTGFNIIVHDSFYSTDYANVMLEGGRYYWKIKQYNSTSASFGNTSATQTFTLVATPVSSDGSTGINGIIYEVTASGSKTPLSNAQVSIYNSTWSDTAITGSNGYYIFSGLANESLYSLKATKNDYIESNVELVTTINGTWVTKDIQLQKCLSGFTCFYTQEYQTIIVKRANGTELAGATVTVYKDTDVVETDSDTTDTYGYVKFLLIKDQRYRVTVTKSDEGISQTEYFYTSSSPYVITISSLSYTTPSGVPNASVTSYNVTYQTNHTWAVQNFTSAYLNSSIGLGMLGQGTLAGIVNWVIVGAGGWLTTILASAVLAYLGIMSWATILFFALTALSLHILTKV